MGDEEGKLADGTSESDGDDEDLDELMSLPELDDEVVLSEAGTIDDLDVAESEQPEQEQESTEETMNSDPLAEVAAIAAERNAEAAKQGSAAAGKRSLVLGGISLLALVVGGFAVWQAYSNSARVDEIAVALQQRGAAPSAGGAKDNGVLLAELDKLATQVNEVAATLDGSLIELRENNQQALDALKQRLDKLEAATTPTSVRKEESATAPAAGSSMKEAPTPAASGKPAGAWSVNLISLSSEQDADKELTRLRNLGIRAEKHRVEQDGRVWFRLRVSGFASRDGAMAYIKTVQSKTGMANAWIGKD